MWDGLDINLYPLSRIGHLLIRLWLIGFRFGHGGRQPEFAQDAKQTLQTAGISPLSKPVPQLRQAQFRVSAAHVPDELEFLRCMLVGVVTGPAGLTRQRLYRAVPACFLEINIRPGSIILSAGPPNAVLLCVFHQGLPVRHVLCYILAHKGCGLLSLLLVCGNSTLTDVAASFILFYLLVQYVWYSYKARTVNLRRGLEIGERV